MHGVCRHRKEQDISKRVLASEKEGVTEAEALVLHTPARSFSFLFSSGALASQSVQTGTVGE